MNQVQLENLSSLYEKQYRSTSNQTMNSRLYNITEGMRGRGVPNKPCPEAMNHLMQIS